MNKHTLQIITAVTIDDGGLDLEELTQLLHTNHDVLTQLIEFELIIPRGDSPNTWRFDSICIRRARRAISFHQDLGVNFNGVSLAMDLLDQIDELEKQLRI